jgi:hypothetical protein
MPASASRRSSSTSEQWAKIVENLAALLTELDRTFVPGIERAAGPSPDWYRPES